MSSVKKSSSIKSYIASEASSQTATADAEMGAVQAQSCASPVSDEDRRESPTPARKSPSTIGNGTKRKSSQSPPSPAVRKLRSPIVGKSQNVVLADATSNTIERPTGNLAILPRTASVIQRPNPILPDHKTAGIDPDTYLIELVEALYGVTLQIQKAAGLNDFFPTVSDEQLSAYNLKVVGLARDNEVAQLRTYYQENGKEALDCYNRFGEGLLNLTCRRGFGDMTQFLLKDVGLNARVRDDYGRTPLHDACWNPEPQLEIARWIVEKDPSLFLCADKRGYTPFQYARKTDWHIWRQFLFDNRMSLQTLMTPELRSRFEVSSR